MSFSTYEATAPILLRSLHKLSALLDKGAASGVPEADLLAARIAPDMLPLTKQIQIISDTAKGAVARLTGVDAPSMPDTEACLVDLKARIAKTIDFIESVDASMYEGAAGRQITLKFPSIEMRFAGSDYISQFVLPNFFFHISIAYALLRMKGVQIGKADFLPVDPSAVTFPT